MSPRNAIGPPAPCRPASPPPSPPACWPPRPPPSGRPRPGAGHRSAYQELPAALLMAVERCRHRGGHTGTRLPPARRCAQQEALVSAYLQALDDGDDPSVELITTEVGRCTLEEAFVAVGAEYAVRRRISSEAWRAVGVPLRVLAAARITPTVGPDPPGEPRSG